MAQLADSSPSPSAIAGKSTGRGLEATVLVTSVLRAERTELVPCATQLTFPRSTTQNPNLGSGATRNQGELSHLNKPD